jgi:hypothetical protein
MIRFLTDYRGVLTGEAFYRAGDVADLPTNDQLVKAGRAVHVESEPTPEPAPVKRTRTRTKAK